MSYYYYEWAPYVSVAARRKQAEREITKLRKKGHPIAPVIIEGRKIATTFWGKAWCENLESYRDFESRLPRGRSYVRNRAVLDLQIAPLAAKALVSGASIYKVKVSIAAVPKAHWRSICQDCVGGIDSLVELLRGRFSTGVMERLCRQDKGLFPRPSDIKFSCSCPDFASMCKHVAAALYGIGARLDEEPELLFRLRAVDENDLLANLNAAAPLSPTGPAAGRILQGDDISALFGLEMAGDDALEAKPPRKKAPARPTPVRRKTPEAAQSVPKPVNGAAPPSIIQTATPAKHARKHAKTAEPSRISPTTRAPAKPGSKSPPSGRRR